VLSPTPSHPVDFGNRKRVNALCAALQERGVRIHFLFYPLEEDWRAAIPEPALFHMRKTWDEFHIIPPTIPVHAAAKGLDHAIDEWWDPALDGFLKWYCARRPLDALLVNYVYLSRAFSHAGHSCLKVLDTHDRVSGRRDKLAELGVKPEFFHTTIEQEAVGLLRADLLLAIKPEEQVCFKSLNGPPVLTVPYAEPRRPSVEPVEDPEGYLRIGILGARNSINVQSVSRFLESAIPRFRDSMAPIKVVLAGSMCLDLNSLKDFDGVEIVGPIKNVRTFYEMVDVVIGPVVQSTGQKIRIGEALAFGAAVISHAHSFEGYWPSHPWHRLEHYEAIAEACIALSFDRTELPALRRASRVSHGEQEALTARALDSLVDRIALSKAADLFVVDAARLSADPLLVRHIAAMIGVAASQSRALVFLSGTANEACAALVQLTRNCARFWAAQEPPSELELEEVALAGSIGELLERFHVGNIWRFGCDQDHEIVGSNYVVVTTLGSLDEAPADAERPGYARQSGGAARFARLIDKDGAPALDIRSALPIPYFSPSTGERAIGGPAFAGAAAVAILTSPISVEFAALVAATIASRRTDKGEQRTILLVAPDGATASRIASQVAEEPALRRCAEVFALQAQGLYERGIELVVDLAGGSAFTLLVEYAAFREIPVLRAPIYGQSFCGARLGEPGGLAFLLEIVKAVRDPDYRDELRESWRKHRDDVLSLKALRERLGESANWTMR
jgi:hypothetical protein